jgi:hypothetical protein
MDQAQLDQEVKSGNAQFIQPPQEQPVTPPPDDTMNQFLGLLTSIRQPLQPLTAAPRRWHDKIVMAIYQQCLAAVSTRISINL